MIAKDRLLAAVVLVMVAILMIESVNIPEKSSWQPYGSALFPRLLLCVIGLLAAIILIKTLLKPTATFQRRTSAMKALRRKGKIIALFVLFGLYALALPYVGFLISTISFMLASQILLMRVNTRKKGLIILGTSFTFAPLIYVIFRYGLNIWLP